MKKHRSAIVGFAILFVLMTAGAAQSLSGSNTVFTDDIVDGAIYNPDIHDRAVTGRKILDDSVTGVDLNEATIPGFKRTYIAKVNLDGTLASGDATSSLRYNPGLYYVYFPAAAKITYGCAAVATSRTQYSPTGYVNTTVNTDYVSVRVTANAANADRPFDLVVVCP